MAYLFDTRDSRFRFAAQVRQRVRQTARGWLCRVPTPCPLCQQRAMGGHLCGPCQDEVTASRRTHEPRCPACCLRLGNRAGSSCPDCAVLHPAFDRVIVAFDYLPPGDALILQFKSARRFQHAPFLAHLLAQTVDAAVPPLPANTILVPVPSSREAIRRRGFNPAAEIARHLAPQLNLTLQPGLLRRRQEGGPQKRLGRTQRMDQGMHRYACSAPVSGANIAIVDDVLTTGATLHGIASELKGAGAASVVGLVLARTPYR